MGDSISTGAMHGLGFLLGLNKQQVPKMVVRDQSAKKRTKMVKRLQRAVRRWLSSNREPAAERAVLRISISSAFGLRNKEFLGTSDPYCKFTLSGRYTNVVRRTRLCQSTLNPTWDEDFHLLIRLERQIELRIEVFDSDVVHDRLMAHASLLLNRRQLVQLALAPKHYAQPLLAPWDPLPDPHERLAAEEREKLAKQREQREQKEQREHEQRQQLSRAATNPRLLSPGGNGGRGGGGGGGFGEDVLSEDSRRRALARSSTQQQKLREAIERTDRARRNSNAWRLSNGGGAQGALVLPPGMTGVIDRTAEEPPHYYTKEELIAGARQHADEAREAVVAGWRRVRAVSSKSDAQQLARDACTASSEQLRRGGDASAQLGRDLGQAARVLLLTHDPRDAQAKLAELQPWTVGASRPVRQPMGKLKLTLSLDVLTGGDEERATGHRVHCKLLRPAAQRGGRAEHAGNVTLRFKYFDGTREVSRGEAQWKHDGPTADSRGGAADSTGGGLGGGHGIGVSAGGSPFGAGGGKARASAYRPRGVAGAAPSPSPPSPARAFPGAPRDWTSSRSLGSLFDEARNTRPAGHALDVAEAKAASGLRLGASMLMRLLARHCDCAWFREEVALLARARAEHEANALAMHESSSQRDAVPHEEASLFPIWDTVAHALARVAKARANAANAKGETKEAEAPGGSGAAEEAGDGAQSAVRWEDEGEEEADDDDEKETAAEEEEGVRGGLGRIIELRETERQTARRAESVSPEAGDDDEETDVGDPADVGEEGEKEANSDDDEPSQEAAAAKVAAWRQRRSMRGSMPEADADSIFTDFVPAAPDDADNAAASAPAATSSSNGAVEEDGSDASERPSKPSQGMSAVFEDFAPNGDKKDDEEDDEEEDDDDGGGGEEEGNGKADGPSERASTGSGHAGLLEKAAETDVRLSDKHRLERAATALEMMRLECAPQVAKGPATRAHTNGHARATRRLDPPSPHPRLDDERPGEELSVGRKERPTERRKESNSSTKMLRIECGPRPSLELALGPPTSPHATRTRASLRSRTSLGGRHAEPTISDELALSRVVLHATIFELLGSDDARLQLPSDSTDGGASASSWGYGAAAAAAAAAAAHAEAISDASSLVAAALHAPVDLLVCLSVDALDIAAMGHWLPSRGMVGCSEELSLFACCPAGAAWPNELRDALGEDDPLSERITAFPLALRSAVDEMQVERAKLPGGHALFVLGASVLSDGRRGLEQMAALTTTKLARAGDTLIARIDHPYTYSATDEVPTPTWLQQLLRGGGAGAQGGADDDDHHNTFDTPPPEFRLWERRGGGSGSGSGSSAAAAAVLDEFATYMGVLGWRQLASYHRASSDKADNAFSCTVYVLRLGPPAGGGAFDAAVSPPVRSRSTTA